MSYPLVIVDAFTDRPFAGNPAGVVILDEPADADWMQQVAAEVNLSETAFLRHADGGWGLRWFTPTVEVPLCGHATLASAHVLWTEGHHDPNETIRFQTASGELLAEPAGYQGENREIVLTFPALPPHPADPVPGLFEALGVSGEPLGLTKPNTPRDSHYLVGLPDAAQLRAVAPDFAALARLPLDGVIVTAPSDDPTFDFMSRCFAPAAGINEDPVTGSAHCTLGPYWRDRLGLNRLHAYQASPRGGVLKVEVLEDTVRLYGTAVTVIRGELVAS